MKHSYVKSIPKKDQETNVLSPRVTTEPRYRAPIPLYPEPRAEREVLEHIKLKLRRNPGIAGSPQYKKNIFAVRWNDSGRVL